MSGFPRPLWIYTHGLLVLVGVVLGVSFGKWHAPEVEMPASIPRPHRSPLLACIVSPETPDRVLHTLVRMLLSPGGEAEHDWRRIGQDLIRWGPDAILTSLCGFDISKEDLRTLLPLTAHAIALADSRRAMEWLDALTPFCDSDPQRDSLLASACEIPATQQPRLIWDAMLLRAPSASREMLQGISLAMLVTEEFHPLAARESTAFDIEFATAFAVQLVTRDVALAKHLLGNLPDGLVREQLASHLAASLAEQAPAEIAPWLASLPASLKTLTLLGEIPVERLAKGPFDSISPLICLADTFSGGEAWSAALIEAWTTHEPSAAASILTADSSLSAETRARIAIALVRVNPAASLPADPDLQRLTVGARTRDRLLSSVAAAESFAAALTDSATRQIAHQNIAWHLANHDSAAAVDFIKHHPEAATRAAVSVLTDHLIQGNPEGTLTWIRQLPSEWQPSLFKQATTWFAENDLHAAEKWATSLPSGPNQDAVFATLAASELPAKALRWVEKIQDSNDRAESLRATFQQWSLHDPDAAARGLEELSAFPDQHAELSRIIEQSRIYLTSKRHAAAQP